MISTRTTAAWSGYQFQNGLLSLYAGGKAINAQVGSSSFVAVSSGGIASGTNLTFDGFEVVGYGGFASATVVGAGSR